MKSLYTPKEFDSAKSRDKLPFECKQCQSTFYASKNEIQKTIKRQHEQNPRRNDLKYCSNECAHLGRHTGNFLPCSHCNTLVYRTPRDLKKSKRVFCSSRCNATYQNTHKVTGYRRSKLEIWIESQLEKRYPNIDIDYNKTDAINAELDIYVPSLNLAFELNGIFHYEPIYGEEKLESCKTNDNRKFQACLERGIELCIINTSGQKKFTEKSSNTFLDIIDGIICRKMGRKTEFESA